MDQKKYNLIGKTRYLNFPNSKCTKNLVKSYKNETINLEQIKKIIPAKLENALSVSFD